MPEARNTVSLRAGFDALSKSDKFVYLTELHAKLIAHAQTGQMTKKQFIAADKRLHAMIHEVREPTRTQDEADAAAELKHRIVAAGRFNPSVDEAL